MGMLAKCETVRVVAMAITGIKFGTSSTWSYYVQQVLQKVR